MRICGLTCDHHQTVVIKHIKVICKKKGGNRGKTGVVVAEISNHLSDLLAVIIVILLC